MHLTFESNLNQNVFLIFYFSLFLSLSLLLVNR